VGVHRASAISTAVDRWYRASARDLAWRIGPADLDRGMRPDPYRVWLSEVMLQQTTAPHAAPYYLRFLARWPTVAALARAPWEDVSAAWAGLGYYSRARNLHACAQAVAEAGGFPQDVAGLTALPGIGPYTASAIAAIAFEVRAAPVDGNIERVASRLWAIGSDQTQAGWRAAKRRIAEAAQGLFDAAPAAVRPGDLAQGLMDLGATVCTPARPACDACPLARHCEGRKEGAPDRYPEKPLRVDRPVRQGVAFVAVRKGEVLLVRRPPTGLLGGMLMPPTTDWSPEAVLDRSQAAPFPANWREVGEVRHVFTHFSLRLAVRRADLARAPGRFECEWMPLAEALASMPTIGRKAVALATASRA
jgi:A/G-specific adenine glycosylase